MEAFSKNRPVLAGVLIIGASILISFLILQKGGDQQPELVEPGDGVEFEVNEPPVYFDMSVEEIMDSHLRFYFEFTKGELITTDIGDVAGDRALQLKDGKRDVFFCEAPYRAVMASDEPCREGSTNKGKGSVTLSHIQVIEEGVLADNIFGILTITRDGEQTTFLVSISGGETEGVGIWEVAQLPESIQVKDITTTSDGVITVSQMNSWTSFPFEWSPRIRHGRPEFHALTQDLKSIAVVSQAAGFKFSYPRKFKPAYQYNSMGRSYSAQEKSEQESVYYAPACDLQNTFEDHVFGVALSGADDEVLFQAGLTAHKITNDVMYLTTAWYGYDPLKWDTITGTASMLQYVKEIQSGAPIAGKTVTFMWIDDQPIRYIEPYLAPRPCNHIQYGQFQWIQDGFLFNLIVEHPVDHLYDNKLTEELLGQIVRTIEPVASE